MGRAGTWHPFPGAGVDMMENSERAGQIRMSAHGQIPNNGDQNTMDFHSPLLSFVVPGPPVAKGRPKFARRGNFVTTYTPEKTASYENLVKMKAEEAMAGRALIDCAVAVSVSLLVSPAASWSQKKRVAALSGEIYPTSKPDIDNCLKGIFDAMNEIVWSDDKQAVDVHVIKRYAETPQAIVIVWKL